MSVVDAVLPDHKEVCLIAGYFLSDQWQNNKWWDGRNYIVKYGKALTCANFKVNFKKENQNTWIKKINLYWNWK